MNIKFIESSVLFLSVIKWIILATCVGVIVGLSTSIFLKLLGISIAGTAGYPYFYLAMPPAFLLSVLIVRYLAPAAEGHGTEKIIEAVHEQSGKIKIMVVPVKLAATIMTIATGGSAGKEGPCAQIGAGLASGLASLLRFDDQDRKKLVICGISAGFSTVFGTPIAGAIFGVEVLFVGGLLYEVLLPSFVAGIVGFQVASALGVAYFHNELAFVPTFSSFFFAKVCLSGIFFGICSLIFIEVLKFLKNLSGRLRLAMPYKALLGGTALVLLTFVFSTRYLGLGLETVQEALHGRQVPIESSFLKMLFTSITLNFGGSGGIVTPIFFVGSTAGNAFGHLPGFDPVIFAAIGLVSVLAGAANTPIAASILSVELFGPAIAPYASVACIISFLITGHRSVYPSQILSVGKSASISVHKGKIMGDVSDIKFHARPGSLIDKIAKIYEKLKNSP